jgi:hypothetical protein
MAMRLLIAALALSLAACGAAAPSAAEPAVTAGSATDGVSEFVANACAGTTYTRCVASLSSVMDAFAGSTVAICEYEPGEGDVVTVDEGETPEGACSGGGLIEPSTVHATLEIPE